MMQAIHHFYPDVSVRYELIVRSEEDASGLVDAIRQEIAHLGTLRFSDADIHYLTQHAPHLKATFLQSLRYFHFVPQEQVEMGIVKQGGKQQLRISIRGSWRDTILYETLVMAISYLKYAAVSVGLRCLLIYHCRCSKPSLTN
uniref:hypothetical protein n=1 Tax=Vibrio cholerae TaxID=666 RepID=UPI003F58CFD6